jgi:hypothetical protein
MQFQIMQHDGGRKFIPAIHDVTKKPLIFDDAKKAAEVAANLTAAKGVKFQPRPLKIEDLFDWKAREILRFKNGEYTPVLWVNERWWKEIPDHFAHIGVKDKTRIAFTPDAEKGEADRQTAMLPGKYLQQFFSDVLTAEQVRKFSMQHATKFEDNNIKWARTVEEIEHVYKVGPDGSCFKGSTKANLYASGDFAVAYIEDTKGKITARALCAVDRMVYPYLYGDRERLQERLKKAGYKLSTNGDDYAGLKLLKQWMWDGWYPDWYPHSDYDDDPDNKDLLIIQ